MTGSLLKTCIAIVLGLVMLTGRRTELSETSAGVTVTVLPDTALAWAQNSVNAVIFRKDPIASGGGIQYIAFYDGVGDVVLGKRKLGTSGWVFRKSGFTGNTGDAHNAISIAVDGAGYLHMAWDHHGHDLNYARSVSPGSIEMSGRLPMTGRNEDRVTYPEFFSLPDGGLLFLYRVGSSGNGVTMLNRYDAITGVWTAVRHPLIDGDGERNAYTNQMAVDRNGGWHISWCWRETGGVQTNHDICYAVSRDGGVTWISSAGRLLSLPITSKNAEYILRIPQNSELINHTSMTVDNDDRPVIATYWRPAGTDVPQYHVIRFDGASWNISQVGARRTPFSLSGAGTKRIPVSRPKVIVDRRGRTIVIFRDEERGSRVSAAISNATTTGAWNIVDLGAVDTGLWEPAYDSALWDCEGILNLYVQYVGQGDAETLEDVPPQRISVYEWKP